MQRRDQWKLEDEVRREFLGSGKLGSHDASLELPADHVVRSVLHHVSSPSKLRHKDRKANRRRSSATVVPEQIALELGDSSAANTGDNVLMLLVREFFFRLRRDHMWTGMFTADIAGRVRMSRPQRVVVLCATCFTSLAVTAFLFSSEPFRVERRLQTGVLSAVVMVIPSMLLPFLFRKVSYCAGLRPRGAAAPR